MGARAMTTWGPARVQASLAALLAIEIVVFASIGSHFLSGSNAAEIGRASAEICLLALALTAVILTGGIDLSAGSLLGLCAVTLGSLWRDAGWPIGAAVAAALAVGAAGGLLNALFVARLGIAPLIVTLATYSLFRGVAEGITAGAQNYSNLPAGLLFAGQGDVAGVPTQVLIVGIAGVGFWLLLHRMTIGRGLRAIGFSSEGARYAGLPVGRRLALVYVLSGLCAGIAAVLYVARVGQAKADAGTGFELFAITAVVLGGTSIFGGKGTVGGTVVGIAVIAVLQNGLRLADLPAELSGVLTAALLLTAICADRYFGGAPQA
jgi:rhamnose transport system substrate-binding protein